jgi:exodeoxyribonuclease-1
MFTRAADLPEGVSRLPVKTIHANKSPVVIGNLNTLAPAMAERWSLDREQGLRHAAWAAAHADDLDALPWRAVFQRPAPAAAPDVDEDLYGGFVGPADRRTLERLRGLDGDALAAKLSGRAPAFDDARLEELLFRYRARNWPATLDADERDRWLQHCQARLHDGVGGGLTIDDFLARIDVLSKTADERGEAILSALVEHAESIAPEPD